MCIFSRPAAQSSEYGARPGVIHSLYGRCDLAAGEAWSDTMQPSVDLLPTIPTDAAQEAASAANVRAAVGRWIIHDLRGPVQSVAMIGELLAAEQGPPDPALRETLAADARRLREM